jgi:hypothetical protein
MRRVLLIATAIAFTNVSARGESLPGFDHSPTIRYVSTSSYTDRDLEVMALYATMIGRGVACGENITPPMLSVGRWMRRIFTASEQSRYLAVFVFGIENAARDQKSGASPDTCRSVSREFVRMKWPD